MAESEPVLQEPSWCSATPELARYHLAGSWVQTREDVMTIAPSILVLTTATCGYPGADATGQSHLDYPANTYIIKVPSPVLFPEQFYYDCFDKGVGGIIVMSCGVECPYEGAYERLAARIDRISVGLERRGIAQGRLKLCSICTVCTKSFLKAVVEMNELLKTQSVTST